MAIWLYGYVLATELIFPCRGNPLQGKFPNSTTLHTLQVDKEFVWSLWKAAQQDLPDVAAMIEMVEAK